MCRTILLYCATVYLRNRSFNNKHNKKDISSHRTTRIYKCWCRRDGSLDLRSRTKSDYAFLMLLIAMTTCDIHLTQLNSRIIPNKFPTRKPIYTYKLAQRGINEHFHSPASNATSHEFKEKQHIAKLQLTTWHSNVMLLELSHLDLLYQPTI